MKIAILVSGFPPDYIGGTETQAQSLARNLAKNGHDVVVFTRMSPRRQKAERTDGFTVKPIGYTGIPILRYLSYIRNAKKAIRQEGGIDLLHCMYISPNSLIGVLLRKTLRVPVICSIRGNKFYTKGWPFSAVSKFVLKRASAILIQTEGQKRELLDRYPFVPADKVTVIPNGIESLPEKSPSNGRDIVYLGRLTRMKGARYLLEALRLMKKPPHAIIGGDGPLMEDLRKQAEGLDVEFMGFVKREDNRTVMKKGKIYVLPSIYGEGFPNTILEAMSAGLPVVTTRLQGMDDIVKDGTTGYLAEPGNPKDLAEKLELLLRDDKLRLSMGRNSLKEVKKYSWKSITSRIESVYMGLTGK